MVVFVDYKGLYVRTNQDPVQMELGTTCSGQNVVSYDGKRFHGEWSLRDGVFSISFDHDPSQAPRRTHTFEQVGRTHVFRHLDPNPAWTVFLIFTFSEVPIGEWRAHARAGDLRMELAMDQS